MMKRQAVYFGVFLFTVCLIFIKQVEAAEFNMTYEEGRYFLEGSSSEFNCMRKDVFGEDVGATVSIDDITPNHGFSYTKESEDVNVSFETYDELLPCLEKDTEVKYKATFSGGIEKVINEQTVCSLSSVAVTISDNVPDWEHLEIVEPAGGIVSGIEEITVEYDTPFFFGGNRCLNIFVCGNTIFHGCNGMPASGSVTKYVDFSKDSGEEVEIKAELTCGSLPFPPITRIKAVCVEQCPPP
jgi:hypothetical protein